MHDIVDIAILGFCNPIIDISCNVSDDFLKRHQLEKGSVTYGEESEMFLLMEEIKAKYSVSYTPGGSLLNCLRIYQTFAKRKEIKMPVGFIGCIGKDENGNQLVNLLEKDGISNFMDVHDNSSTALCACLITEKERTLKSLLGAASKYSDEHFKKSEVQLILQSARFVCSTGFFINSNFQVIMDVAKTCKEKRKNFVFNLSSQYFLENYFDMYLQILPYTDYLFGNKDEYSTLLKCLNVSDLLDYENSEDMFKKLEYTAKFSTTFICTMGSHPTIVSQCLTERRTKFYPVNQVVEKDIVDLNGAGDAFQGGFLFGLAQELEMDEIIKYAHFSAAEVIKNIGCSFASSKILFPE